MSRLKSLRVGKPESAGQSLVEFALTLPLLLLIFIGTVDLGRIYFSYMTVVNATREGVRFGAGHPPADPTDPNDEDVMEIVWHVRNEASGSGVNPANMTIVIDYPDGTSGDCQSVNSTCYPIRVTVSLPFTMISTYVLGGGPLTLTASDEMQVYVSQ